MIIVDTHMHPWTTDWEQYPFAPPEATMKRPEEPNTAEEIVEMTERQAVDFTVLVQVRYYGWDNRYLADCLRRFPGRFAAQGLIDPRDPAAADRLAYWMQEHGLAGMRLSPSYDRQADWLNSPGSYPLWRRAEELGAVFNFLIREEQLPELGEMAARFPGVPVVVDHMGYPDIAGDTAKLVRLARLPNVHVKVTEFYNHSKTREYPYADVLPTVRRVYDAFGPQRLMWGTGFVHGERVGRIPYAQELELIREHVPFFRPADQEWILGRTALSLWRFGETNAREPSTEAV
jgi:predicted TIM-barrel fold metal-dependent hydrolase